MKTSVKLTLIAAMCAGTAAQANVQITEWMYSGNGPEFIEFTNLGAGAVDFAGWSYDDDSGIAGTFDLSSFGSVAAGESVLITEGSAADFRTAWGLSASVKVIGGYTNNLGRNDAIYLFDASNVQVDRFAYGDQNYAGTIRTQNASGTPTSLSALATQAVDSGWVLSSLADSYGSYASAHGDLGNPGLLAVAVPEPETYAMMLVGLGALAALSRRRAA